MDILSSMIVSVKERNPLLNVTRKIPDLNGVRSTAVRRIVSGVVCCCKQDGGGEIGASCRPDAPIDFHRVRQAGKHEISVNRHPCFFEFSQMIIPFPLVILDASEPVQ